MTEDYAVQQKTSATPYLLGGAAVGATGGYFVDKIPGFNGISKAKYTSFDDILKEKKDFFTKTENMSDELKEAAGKINAKRDEVVKYIKDNASKVKLDDTFKDEYDAVAKARTELKSKYIDALKEIKNKKGEIEALKNVEEKDLDAAVKKYLKENIDKEEYKSYREALTKAQEASKKLHDKVKAEGKPAKVIDGLKNQKEEAWKAIKDEAAKYKTANKAWNMVALGAIVALLAAAVRPKHKDA